MPTFIQEREQFANLISDTRKGRLVILVGTPGDGKVGIAEKALRAQNKPPYTLDIPLGADLLNAIPVLDNSETGFQMVKSKRLDGVIQGKRALLVGSLEMANPAQVEILQNLASKTAVVGTWNRESSGSLDSAGAFAAQYDAFIFDQERFFANPKFVESIKAYQGDLNKVLSDFVLDPKTGEEMPQGGGIQAALAIADRNNQPKVQKADKEL